MIFFSKTITQSLQWRLLLTLTLVCLLFSGLVATVSFYQSYHQAQILQDAKLESLVSLAKSHDLSIENDQIDIDFKQTNLKDTVKETFKDTTAPNLQTIRPNLDALEQDIATNQTLIYWLDDARLQAYFNQNRLHDLAGNPDGFYELQGKNGSWRVYIYTQVHQQVIKLTPSEVKKKKLHGLKTPIAPLGKTITKKRRLLIGELLDIRNQLAWQSAKKILVPLLLLIPLLLLVIIATVHHVFKPLAQITDKLNQNFNNAINPNTDPKTIGLNNQLINASNEEKLPNEIRPFIQIIREQMQQLITSLTLNQRFVSNASHQLRTPMTAILLQAEQIKLNDNATPEQIHEQSLAIDNLLDSIKRNNHLINQLLTLSKSEQKSQTLSNAILPPFSANQVVTEVLLDFYPIASQKNINLGVAVLEDVNIHIAALSFKIIVQNLLENAIKYTPEGGRVDIGLFATAGFVYLVVQDSGIGIVEAELDKILEPFYRANAVTQTSQTNAPMIEGFGLGLAIVNNLVLASHADMTIANHQNLQKSHPNFRPELAEKIIFFKQQPTVTSLENTDTPLENPLFDTPDTPVPQQMVSDFRTGLYVQIRWQQI